MGPSNVDRVVFRWSLTLMRAGRVVLFAVLAKSVTTARAAVPSDKASAMRAALIWPSIPITAADAGQLVNKVSFALTALAETTAVALRDVTVDASTSGVIQAIAAHAASHAATVRFVIRPNAGVRRTKNCVVTPAST